MTPVMTEAELGEFMWRAFPQAAEDFRVEHLTADGIVMRLKVADKHLRPGGTISGPSIFGLADVAVYLAILARIGPVALAVTTNGADRLPAQTRSGRRPSWRGADFEAGQVAGGGRCADPVRGAGGAGGTLEHDLFDSAPSRGDVTWRKSAKNMRYFNTYFITLLNLL